MADPHTWAGLVLPVGHRLGPLHDPAARGAEPSAVVRRGDVAELLTPAEARVWELARPVPGEPLAGDAVQLEQRIARTRSDPALVERLCARGLLLRVTPENPDSGAVSAGVRAMALGAALGGEPDADLVSFGTAGRPLLAVPGPAAEAWLAAVYAPDLWSAAAVLLAFRDPLRTTMPSTAEHVPPLAELWSVVPRFLAARCGYLDVVAGSRR